MSLCDIHFLFNVHSFNFKLDWDVDSNIKTNPYNTLFLFRVNYIILPYLFKCDQTSILFKYYTSLHLYNSIT